MCKEITQSIECFYIQVLEKSLVCFSKTPMNLSRIFFNENHSAFWETSRLCVICKHLIQEKKCFLSHLLSHLIKMMQQPWKLENKIFIKNLKLEKGKNHHSNGCLISEISFAEKLYRKYMKFARIDKMKGRSRNLFTKQSQIWKYFTNLFFVFYRNEHF